MEIRSVLCMLCVLHATMGSGIEVVDASTDWTNYLENLKLLQTQLDADNDQVVVHEIGRNTPREIFFNVSFESPPQKKTVHTLTPHDIDVLGALGDSLTAGTGAGAYYLPGIAIQFRGISWLGGGDESLETSMTLATILRKFNPDIKGYSVGNGLGYASREEDWFNVAVPGGRAHDMLDQAQNLVNLLKNDSRTSFENDWKLISIFIGGNDLCAIGNDPNRTTAEAYVGDIKKALDLFQAEVPRTIVQVIQILEIYLLPQVADADNAYPLCGVTQQLFCGYVASGRNDDELKRINRDYQIQLAELIDSGVYDERDDFTVVLQPFFENTVLPVTEDGKVDASFFAPDCFHFSSKGHAMGALNVWNNMMEPIGEKAKEWSISDLKCPTVDNPYIFTSGNSHSTKHRNRQQRDVKAEYAESPCIYEDCNKMPSWVSGVIIALVVVMAIESFLMFVVHKVKH